MECWSVHLITFWFHIQPIWWSNHSAIIVGDISFFFHEYPLLAYWAPCFFLSPRTGCWNTNTKYCVTFNWLWINILHRLILCVLCCLHPHFCANLNTLTLGELPAKCRLFRCKTLDSETLQTGDCNSKQSHIFLQLNYIYIYIYIYI